jgi:hypothetical protein
MADKNFPGAVPIGQGPEPDRPFARLVPREGAATATEEVPEFKERIRSLFLKHLKRKNLGVELVGFDVEYGMVLAPQPVIGWLLIFTAKSPLINKFLIQVHPCADSIPLTDADAINVINRNLEGLRRTKAQQASALNGQAPT